MSFTGGFHLNTLPPREVVTRDNERFLLRPNELVRSENEDMMFGPAHGRLSFFLGLFVYSFGTFLTHAEVIGAKWGRQYDGTNYPSFFGENTSFDQARAITVDREGNALVAAQSDGFHMSKYSGENGILLWERRIGTGSNFSDTAFAIAADANGDVIATGVLDTDFYTAKYAGSDGHLLWEKRYNGSGNERDAATSLAIDSSGNVIVIGTTVTLLGTNEFHPLGPPSSTDIYTVKYDGTDGHLLWEQRHDGPAHDYDYPLGLGVDEDGNAFVAGSSTRFRDDGSLDSDIYTVKYAGLTGEILWEKRADGANVDYATGLVVDRFGDVVVNGSFGNGQTAGTCYTVKYSGADGRVLWDRTGTTADGISIGPVAADFGGNIVVTGSYQHSEPNGGRTQGLYTAKFAADDGRLLWEQKYIRPIGGQDARSGAIKVDLAGNVVIGGTVALSTSPYKWRLYAAGYSGIDGSIAWEKLFSAIGPQYEETFGGLALDPEGSAFLTGSLFPRPSGDDVDMFVVKLARLGQLLNLSTRMQVDAGENVAIGGFIVAGPETSTKKMLLRGLGPSLSNAGVRGALQDPMLELHLVNGTIITNNDWRDTQQAEIEATGIAPPQDSESAIVTLVPPGAHTVVLRGTNNGTGIGLVELYDLEGNGLTNVANISTRGRVETGDKVMITGFIIGGTRSGRILVRALGPSLTAYGISGNLQDPSLELHDQNGGTVANDDWRSTQEAEITATGAAPGNNKEAALIATLLPGPYTALVRGVNGTTGVALVDAYNLQ